MVAMNVWPTDASNGAVSSEARWRAMARQWLRSGVLTGVGGGMAPSLAGLNLTVQAGAAWVDGHYCELVTQQVLTATANGIAVVRFDPAANTAELLWRDGVTVPTQTLGGVWEILIASTSGSVMTDRRYFAGSNQTTAPRYSIRAYRNAALSLPPGWTTIIFDTKSADPDNVYSTTTGEYTTPLDGLYAFHASVIAQAQNNPQQVILALWMDGVEQQRGNMFQMRNVTGGDPVGLICSGAIQFAAGKKLSVRVQQGGGNSIPLNVTDPSPWAGNTFSIYRVAP